MKLPKLRSLLLRRETIRLDRNVATNLSDKMKDQVSADFLKMFSGAVVGGIVILGYAYSHTFFRNFGLSLLEVEVEWIDILFRGIALIEDPLVALVSFVVIVLVSLVFALRNFFSASGKIAISALGAFLYLLAAIFGAQYVGYKHARSIWKDGAGNLAFCRIKQDDTLKPFIQSMDQLSRENRIRYLYTSKDFVFLAPVLKNVDAGRLTGESYAIPIKSILYCRIVGS